ncbi:hypothetical protein SCCGRSA3_02002 [Marine Group I thaumarchaeote SCGC RSA3]|uniref:Uncharacterized protein n=1 Tax=Marine Group I thaumarchaeote SCGC RSA3 TaxID=1503183 RepID=A0A087RU13_9ARCH|nr:hypothetical protein SCCGRSA3_02002 [Marine Group I thaumarchaeote SCGC RSA3]
MKRSGLLVVLLLISGSLFYPTDVVLGQLDDAPEELEDQNLGAYVWAPKNMIKGETYDAVVILKQATNHGDLALISTSDPSVIRVPQSVSILPYSNHGIFSVDALKQREADLFISINGELAETRVMVHSASRQPDSLDILVPSNQTKSDKMIGYVISIDSNGSPVPVKEDVQIRLSASSMIDVPEIIQIKKDSHYASFVANIAGSGKIFASAQGLKLATQEITKLQDEITVRVAVAPDVAMQNSKAFFYVWLEKDGKPFKPPYVTEAFLSSSDTEIVRFSENRDITHYGDSVLSIPVIDGVGKGVLVTDKPGAAIITANVKGFGSAQTNMVVGSVLLDEDFEIISPQDEEEFDKRVRLLSERMPTIAFSWFYPKITDGKAYGVVALYNMNVTKDIVTDVNFTDTSITVTDQINRVVPVPLDGRTITISSMTGLKYPDVLVLSESNEVAQTRGSGFNHAVEFEVDSLNEGNYTISVSGPGLDRFQSNLDVVSAYSESYTLSVIPIPALPGLRQDLAMISVLDESGVLVDVGKTFLGPIKLDISTTNIEEGTSNLSISGTGTAVYGGLVNENARITASASGISPFEVQLKPAGIAASIEFDVPKIAHISEKIPYAIHEIDVFGTPLKRIFASSMSATPGIVTDGNYLISNAEDEARIAVLSTVGADGKTIDTFANDMDLSISSYGNRGRVGKELQVNLLSDIGDVKVLVDSPLPYKKLDDDLKYVITPDREGYFNVTFTGIKEGYKTKNITYGLFAEKIIDLLIKAIGSDGNELNISQTVSIGNVSSTAITPYSAEIKPQFFKTKLPAQFDVGDKGYTLTKATGAGKEFSNGMIDLFLEKDTTILAKYERMVQIDVAGAEGSGFYPYGQMITLSVPPKDKMSFLVREVFDYWDGLPYEIEPVSFTASEDISASVVYRDDYSFLMLVIAVIVTTVLYTTAIRKKVNLRWEISKLVDLLRNNIKVNSPKVSHIRKSFEGKKKKKFSWQLKRKKDATGTN